MVPPKPFERPQLTLLGPDDVVKRAADLKVGDVFTAWDGRGPAKVLESPRTRDGRVFVLCQVRLPSGAMASKDMELPMLSRCVLRNDLD